VVFNHDFEAESSQDGSPSAANPELARNASSLIIDRKESESPSVSTVVEDLQHSAKDVLVAAVPVLDEIREIMD
jgi:hypothetical protein